MKHLTQEQRILRILAASGAIEGFKRKIDWGLVNLICCITGVAVFVGFCLAMILLATINGG